MTALPFSSIGFWLDDPAGAELAAAADAMPFAAARALVSLGISRATVAGLTEKGVIGRARVVERGGRWEPDEAGAWRLLLAVMEQGQLVDVLALSSADPDNWALRNGDGAVLGRDAIDDATMVAAEGGKAQLRLHGTPFAWLAAGCKGACVLDWNAHSIGLLRWLGSKSEIITDDSETAEALRHQLAFGGLPSVRFTQIQGRLAA